MLLFIRCNRFICMVDMKNRGLICKMTSASEERALWLVELLPVSCRLHTHVKVSNRATRLLELDKYCSSDLTLAKYEWPGSDSRPSASAVHRSRVPKAKISAAGASNDWGLLGKNSSELAAPLYYLIINGWLTCLTCAKCEIRSRQTQCVASPQGAILTSIFWKSLQMSFSPVR